MNRGPVCTSKIGAGQPIGKQGQDQAHARMAEQNRRRLVKIGGVACTIAEVERRTGLTGRPLSRRLQYARAKAARRGSEVTWEMLA